MKSKGTHTYTDCGPSCRSQDEDGYGLVLELRMKLRETGERKYHGSHRRRAQMFLSESSCMRAYDRKSKNGLELRMKLREERRQRRLRRDDAVNM